MKVSPTRCGVNFCKKSGHWWPRKIICVTFWRSS
jgi:hypothetical protein